MSQLLYKILSSTWNFARNATYRKFQNRYRYVITHDFF